MAASKEEIIYSAISEKKEEEKEINIKYNQYFLHPKNIKFLLRHVTDPNIDFEICGYLNIENNSLEDILVGKQDATGRKMCNQLKGTLNGNFHTHPYDSKFYPSREDLRKLLKYNNLETSILITKVGIWFIRKIKSFYYNKNYNKDYMSKIDQNLVERILENIRKREKGEKIENEEKQFNKDELSIYSKYLRLEKLDYIFYKNFYTPLKNIDNYLELSQKFKELMITNDMYNYIKKSGIEITIFFWCDLI